MAYANEIMLPAYSLLQGLGAEMIGATGAPMSSQTWSSLAGAANVAIYMPIYFNAPGIITKLWMQNGSTAAGNVDVGLYTCVAGLPAARVVSAGSTAQAGTNVLQEFNITDYVVAYPQILFIAVAADATTTTMWSGSVGAMIGRACGLARQTSAFPLPATATPGTLAQGQIPAGCGVSFRALVA